MPEDNVVPDLVMLVRRMVVRLRMIDDAKQAVKAPTKDKLRAALEEIADHRFQHPWGKCQQIAMEALKAQK